MRWKSWFSDKGNAASKPFQGAVLKETAAQVVNPGRGWYQLYSFSAGQEIDTEELKWSLDKQDGLALVLIDIGDYRETSIDQAGLCHIRQILQFFAEHQVDMVLRAVYDREGKGPEREPDLFAQLIEHIRQVGSIASDYAEHILAVQGLLLGSWGEMHGSKYLSAEKMRILETEWQKATGGKCVLSVRRPVFLRYLRGDRKAVAEGGIGLFDDAMFASESHLGTFGEKTEAEAGWLESWLPEEEMAFMDSLGDILPFGGEAVCPEEVLNGEHGLQAAEVLHQLRQMHVTYLNRIYDSRLLDRWKQMSCGVAGIWQACSLYDYIGAHLGYRFVVCQVKCTVVKGKSPLTLELKIEIENRGFAGLYEDAELFVIAESAQEIPKGMAGENPRSVQVQAKGAPGTWRAGSKHQVTAAVALPQETAESWRFYLELVRKKDGRNIKFANRCSENQADGCDRVFLGTYKK